MFKIIYFMVLISCFGLFVLYWKYVHDTIKDYKNFRDCNEEERENVGILEEKEKK